MTKRINLAMYIYAFFNHLVTFATVRNTLCDSHDKVPVLLQKTLNRLVC